MDHVRVRQDRVRPLADLPALLGRGVAVVDRRPELRHPECVQRSELILGERFGRVEVEHAVARCAHERVEHGQVEGERLPGCRAGRDDQVLAARRRLPRRALVDVEGLDPDRRRGRADRTRPGAALCGLRGSFLAAVGELLTLEQLVRDAKGDAQSANSTRRRSSTDPRVAAPTDPNRRISRSVEMDRAPSQITNERFLNPPSGGSTNTQSGARRSCVVNGVTRASCAGPWFRPSLEITSTGLVPPCSCPRTGLSSASHTSPRVGVRRFSRRRLPSRAQSSPRSLPLRGHP